MAAGLLLATTVPCHPVYAKDEGTAVVMRVKDANVLVLKGGQEVRLIGIRAPVPFDDARNKSLADSKGLQAAGMEDAAREAKDFVKYLVEGQTVRIELDPGLAQVQHRDREGRVMAYVWFAAPIFQNPPDWLVVDPDPKTSQDAFLNAILARAGYSTLETDWPFAFGGKFLALEEEAKTHQRGFWKLLLAKPEPPSAASNKTKV